METRSFVRVVARAVEPEALLALWRQQRFEARRPWRVPEGGWAMELFCALEEARNLIASGCEFQITPAFDNPRPAP